MIDPFAPQNAIQQYVRVFGRLKLDKISQLNTFVTIKTHYSDVIMGAMAYQITSLTIAYSPFIQAQIKENIKAPRHWPLWGEFTGDRWIRRTKGQ